MLKSVCASLAMVGLLAVSHSASAADTQVLSGKIQSVAKDHIVLKVKDKTHKVSVKSDTQITLDGKKAALNDLKSGFTASVTARKEGTGLAATKIEAKSKAAAPASLLVFADEQARKYTGTVKQVEKTTLQITDAKKKTHSFNVGSATTITLNGKRATLAQLKAGYKVKVTAVEKDGKLMAKTIAATSAS